MVLWAGNCVALGKPNKRRAKGLSNRCPMTDPNPRPGGAAAEASARPWPAWHSGWQSPRTAAGGTCVRDACADRWDSSRCPVPGAALFPGHPAGVPLPRFPAPGRARSAAVWCANFSADDGSGVAGNVGYPEGHPSRRTEAAVQQISAVVADSSLFFHWADGESLALWRLAAKRVSSAATESDAVHPVVFVHRPDEGHFPIPPWSGTHSTSKRHQPTGWMIKPGN